MATILFHLNDTKLSSLFGCIIKLCPQSVKVFLQMFKKSVMNFSYIIFEFPMLMSRFSNYLSVRVQDRSCLSMTYKVLSYDISDLTGVIRPTATQSPSPEQKPPDTSKCVVCGKNDHKTQFMVNFRIPTMSKNTSTQLNNDYRSLPRFHFLKGIAGPSLAITFAGNVTRQSHILEDFFNCDIQSDETGPINVN